MVQKLYTTRTTSSKYKQAIQKYKKTHTSTQLYSIQYTVGKRFFYLPGLWFQPSTSSGVDAELFDLPKPRDGSCAGTSLLLGVIPHIAP